MKDSDFKALSHIIPEGCSIHTKGEELSQGYKPDLSVENSSRKVVLICENEIKTDRKAFLGDLIKAERYYDEEKSKGDLLIVLKEQDNTTVGQIAKHISPYFKWLKTTRLSPNGVEQVLIITDVDYQEANCKNETILSPEFKKRCKVLAEKGLND